MCVVLDPGHGGKDPGAKGFFSLCEKDLTLDVVNRIKPLLEGSSIHVILTRTTDQEMHRLKRSEFAYEQQADLFVSIHANSMGSRTEISGIETFYLSRQARPQKNYFLGNICDKRHVLQVADSLLKNNNTYSRLLAQSIHNNVVHHLVRNGFSTKDRGVRQEAYCVLLRSQVPIQAPIPHMMLASLVEIGYITNEEDAACLRQSPYRQLIAEGISDGIKKFLCEKGLI